MWWYAGRRGSGAQAGPCSRATRGWHVPRCSSGTGAGATWGARGGGAAAAGLLRCYRPLPGAGGLSHEIAPMPPVALAPSDRANKLHTRLPARSCKRTDAGVAHALVRTRQRFATAARLQRAVPPVLPSAIAPPLQPRRAQIPQ